MFPVAGLPVYPLQSMCYGVVSVVACSTDSINQSNKTKMESLNKNGVSITQTPGEEKYIECCLGAFRGQIYIQYDYRHTNGKLYSTVAKTLETCRQKRDEWIKRQEQPLVYILFQTDVHKTKSSRIWFGVYSSEEKAIEAAKKNDLYTHQAEVVILECDIDSFSEL